jgi:uncharacterized membrane protein
MLLSSISASPAWAFWSLFDSVETVTAKDGLITLNTSTLSTGEAKHYQYKEGGAVIRFFIVKDAGGVVRAALDACEVCWRENKGYKQQNGAMLCVNCGQRFALNRIGQIRGGCNPHPIAFTTKGETFTVTSDELKIGLRYFPEGGK